MHRCKGRAETNGRRQQYRRYWGLDVSPAEDASDTMRDDVFGLSALRMFPDAPKTPARAPVVPKRSTFEIALAQANNARQAQNAQQRYASPLKPSNRTPLPSTHRPTTSKPLAGSTTHIPSLAKPLTTSRAAPARPAPAPQRAEAPRPAASTSTSTPMALGQYPHPDGDNGRGMHWIPATKQSTAVVDRFVAEAQRMGVKWVTFLNDGASVGQNDYLVSKLVV